MDKSAMGNRMKSNYENRNKVFLTRRVPVMIRLDGRCFSTFTKGMDRPFDSLLMNTIQKTAKYLCENIQGCRMAYTQSDEITLLLTDYDKLTTDAWFDYNVQKMCSISASMATLAFNRIFRLNYENYVNEQDVEIVKQSKWVIYGESIYNKIDKAMFDSRVFNIPKEEVVNCFIWRQKDATRNSIQMVGQSQFSHKELHEKSINEVQNMLLSQKDINWNNFTVSEKRGTAIIKTDNGWEIDFETPIFQDNRDYIERLI